MSGYHDPNLHLFVDDDDIHHYVNLERVLNKPSRVSQPVVEVDRPWEGDRAQSWGSVVKETDGTFRMFYFAFNTTRKTDQLDRGGYALAESIDGRHWHKPELGVVSYQGSTANNLWYTFAPDGNNIFDQELARRGIGLPAIDENGDEIGVLNNMDGHTVVLDEEDPDPNRRYKLIANMQDHRMWAEAYREWYTDTTDEEIAHARTVMGQYMDTSPDGVHWTRRPQRLLPMRYGDYMMVARDHRNGRWWLNERTFNLFGRNAAMRTSEDLIDWTEAEMVMSNQPDAGFGRRYEWHAGITPFNYGKLNLGFLEKWCNSGAGDFCELVSQREGQTWRRVAPEKPFLDTGPRGQFDDILVYPSHNEPIAVGNRLYIYYTGGRAGGFSRGIDMAMGVMWIVRDRFVGMAHSRREPGELITKPIVVEQPKLQVNAERLLKGEVRVGLRDVGGDFIPGYGLEDSRIDLMSATARTPVRWKDHRDLSELRGRKIHLHFQVDGASLYAYRFYDGQ